MRTFSDDAAMLGASTYDRRDGDFYPSPPWCTECLLRHFSFRKIWEPACGEGHMSQVLMARGYDVRSSDLFDRGFGEPGVNFLSQVEPTDRDIVTNPPYRLADEFIRHALTLTREAGGKVAFLVR